MLKLMPERHKAIRDTLVRLKDNHKAKVNLLKDLENSENFTKSILLDKYRHFSEDYPEVQLILQQTEHDKMRKNKLISKMYKEYTYNFATSYEEVSTQQSKQFQPFQKRQGKLYDLQPNPKKFEYRKERTGKKVKKLTLKKEEKRLQRHKKKNIASDTLKH
jgi:hypothetical protein